MKNKILITGGAGYVGSTLVPLLLKSKYYITVVDTFWFGNYLPKNKRIKIIKKNILTLRDKDMKGVHTVVHLASVANDTASDLNPKLTWEISCLGTKHLCDLAKKIRLRNLFLLPRVVYMELKKRKK